MTRRRLALALLCWLLGAGSVARAHPLQFSYVDINLSARSTDVVVTAHAFDVAHDLGLASESLVLEPGFAERERERVAALLLGRLQLVANGEALSATVEDVEVVADQLAVVLRLRYPPMAGRTAEVKAWLFPYDSLHQTFINIYENGALRRADFLTAYRGSLSYGAGDSQSLLDVVRRFVRSGITHIVIGPDHVLFLVGLLLLGGNLWQLVRIVTGFTAAHSITLSLAALGVVTPPARLVEPVIALSICFVGFDNLLRRPGGRDHRVWIAMGFGLIHGFGFASVLGEMDLPRQWLAWALFSFNLGVEIGQLAIVLIVSLLLAWIARRSPVSARRLAVAGSVVVIWAGAFWFVERTFFAS